MIQKVAIIALLAALGGVARYLLTGLVQQSAGGAFPWGTLFVNCLGCLLFGFVWSLADERMLISGTTRLLILVGFFGSFTTFSTFAFETGQLIRDSEWLFAAGNLIVQNVIGILAVFTGIALGRAI